MKREEVLERLKKWIPSFQREYTGYSNGEWDWLFRNEYYSSGCPDKVPYKWLEGEKMVDSKGKELTVLNRHLQKEVQEYRRKNKEPQGRHIHWEYRSFPGHPHYYMELKTSGPQFTFVDEQGRRCSTSVWESELEKYPNLKGASSILETELFRILSQKDIDKAPGDWEYYEAGFSTNRFLDAAEMFATAAYVTLYRYEGPLVLLRSNYCVAYNKEDLILSVNSRDTVTVYNRALKLLVED